MTFGRVAEALPRAIRLVGWPKLVIFFFFFFFLNQMAHLLIACWRFAVHRLVETHLVLGPRTDREL